MATYTCKFAGDVIDASLYEVIDFGTDAGKIEYLDFELTANFMAENTKDIAKLHITGNV